MSLEAFLGHNVAKAEEVEIVISDRFKDKDGNPVPFKFKPLTGEEDEIIRKECTVQEIDKNGRPNVTFDSTGYSRKMAVATITFPNLHNQELQDSYGAMGAEELLPKMLNPGEYAKVLKHVQSVNGFKPFGEMEEEAKNE